MSEINKEAKQLLLKASRHLTSNFKISNSYKLTKIVLILQENFEGSALIVPDLEGMLYLKEDGKKVWKPRYFMLRASGIYFVPKGKTKVLATL